MTTCVECGDSVRAGWSMDHHSRARFTWNPPAPSRCSDCLAKTRREVELHAAVWAPLLIASLGMTGRWPEIDPSLLRSSS